LAVSFPVQIIYRIVSYHHRILVSFVRSLAVQLTNSGILSATAERYF